MSTTAQYLKTLRRIPDDIVLSMATRGIDVNNGNVCICGWAIREAVGRAAGRDAADTPVADILSIRRDLARRFGGTEQEWDNLYFDVGYYGGKVSVVEAAFVTRVMEAAGVA